MNIQDQAAWWHVRTPMRDAERLSADRIVPHVKAVDSMIAEGWQGIANSYHERRFEEPELEDGMEPTPGLIRIRKPKKMQCPPS